MNASIQVKLCAALGSMAIGLMAFDTLSAEQRDWRNLYLDAKPVLDVRYRFEHVDQDSADENANAHTVRTRIGFETGRFYGVGVGFDYEWIEGLGDEDFNDTVNGKTQFPVVADPDDEQINQLFIVATDTLPGTEVKLGRQRIIWDDARFIGNVGFRQNEQTFDALRGQITALADTTLEYLYLEEVRRVFGTDSPVGDFDMSSHGLRAQYTGFEQVTLTPFALLLDYDPDDQSNLDSQSYGLLAQAALPINEQWKFLFDGSLAYQKDYEDNPNNFDLWYYRAEPGLSYNKITLKAGYELLEGDGTDAFQTPLATLHKFNGLTDQFLTTPADGLQDLYFSLKAPLPGDGLWSGFSIEAAYHEFWSDRGGRHFGSEWDAGIFKKFATDYGNWTAGIQYAAYDADNFSSDTDKLWVSLQYAISPKPFSAYFGEAPAN